VQCNAAGQVVLKLKTPWRDGTTRLAMSPLEFIQRLAARSPHRPSRLPMGCSSGVLNERQLYGDQFTAANVKSGSMAGAHPAQLVGTNVLWTGL
jgi:hypothetical protein